jgi:hypothetical protein
LLLFERERLLIADFSPGVKRPQLAGWSEAGMPFTMCSNAKDTGKSLATSDGSLAQMHPPLTESEQIAVDAIRKREEKVRTHEPRTR